MRTVYTGVIMKHDKYAILDSNFLLAPYQFRIDVVEEIQDLGFTAITLSCVISEIEHLVENRGKTGSAAKIALEIINKRKIPVKHADGLADKTILEYALKEGCAVATNDAKLIRKLKEKKIEVLRIKQRKLVAVD